MSGPRVPDAPNGAPAGFVDHAFNKWFETPHSVERVWRWLNDPATFTESQIWPFRVEFVDGGFEPGVLNVHHGPLINFAGVIGEVRAPGESPIAYRDLKYFYGSYALSPRLVRPTRLRFWVEAAPKSETTDETTDAATVTLRLDSLVREPFTVVWEVSQRTFWTRFPRWLERDLDGRSS